MWELQLTQEKEVVKEELLKRNWRTHEEFGRKEAAVAQEIMELQEINGRLQLELKCAKKQVELCEFRLVAERNKVERLVV